MDNSPTADGKFKLLIEPGEAPPLAVAASPGDQLRYDTHFATCPFSGQHRRR